jgi:predicted  nucleic acid-binding Zn-ribbon protein/ABC-type hemin transport system ATPase subunit
MRAHGDKDMTTAELGATAEPTGMDLPNIALPVFLRVDIEGYELFPGKDGAGLHHVFAPGVTVVAGINGLGKTTLLNILLRVLLGPRNPEKVTPFEVGAKSHELIPWKKARRFFSSRVSDAAANAVVRAEVQIGNHTLVIARQLKDLKLSYLSYDRQELDPTEVEFERVALDASNAASRYDFDFLVRYLVFFLEQRVPLFWNERGQIEVFRILLCDSELATKFHQKQDAIQAKDSFFRNFRWQAGIREKQLRAGQEAFAGAGSLGAKVSALQSAFKALSNDKRGILTRLTEVSDERSSLRTDLLLKKIELEEARRGYEGIQQDFLASLFPNVSDSARYIFSTILSEIGCAVCGNRTERGAARLGRLLKHGDCPACESPTEEQERLGGIQPVDPILLSDASDKLTKLQTAVSGLEQRELELKALYVTRAAELTTIQRELQIKAAELEKLNAILPPTPDELKHLQQQVEDDGDELKRLEDELQGLYSEYEGLIAMVSQRVTQIEGRVRELFSEYAQSFMEEDCTLGLSKYKDDVGQSRTFEYPCFTVYMTSATSHEVRTVRSNDEDVSESQREFIDLAFRMALIAAAASEGSRSMLVIETPEASLDAYFVDQAGELLRQFGRGNDPKGNVVIVSSNLARQNMISALLGFSNDDETQWPDSQDVEQHLINLLDEASPNAALRKKRAIYEQALKEATRSRLISRAG